jgi:hypothetical protein
MEIEIHTPIESKAQPRLHLLWQPHMQDLDPFRLSQESSHVYRRVVNEIYSRWNERWHVAAACQSLEA